MEISLSSREQSASPPASGAGCPSEGRCHCTAHANPACTASLKQYAQHFGSAFLISGFHTIANNELPDGK